MKDKKRNFLILIITMFIFLPFAIISYKVAKKDKMYEARKEIDEIANQELTNDPDKTGSGEVELLLANISIEIDKTIKKVKRKNVRITPETTDTLFTAIKDNLHIIKLMHSEARQSVLDENWQDSIKTSLLKNKSADEYVVELNKLKNKIIELKESL